MSAWLRASSPSGPTGRTVGDRGAWVKSKCLNRAEFVVVSWSDPEGSRHLVGSLLLGYYDPEGRLIYAGIMGTGMSFETLAMLHKRVEPLATAKMPLSSPPPRGSPSEARWPCPKCTGCDRNSSPKSRISAGLTSRLRHTVFVGLREDKPAREVRREVTTQP